MDRSTCSKPGQAGSDRSARPDHTYAQVPLCLLRLPTGERAAAIEVWVTLHHHLRLGSTEQRVTDETLSQSPYLASRSAEHARKGLEVLERVGLITRRAKGSSRRVAILGRLKSVSSNRRITVAQSSHECRIDVARKSPDPSPEEIALMKQFFPKRCEGLLVPGN